MQSFLQTGTPVWWFEDFHGTVTTSPGPRPDTRTAESYSKRPLASWSHCPRCWSRSWLTRRGSSPPESCTGPRQTTRSPPPSCPPSPPTPRPPPPRCRSRRSRTSPSSAWSSGWWTPRTGRTWRCSPGRPARPTEPRTPSWPRSSRPSCPRCRGRPTPPPRTLAGSSSVELEY